MPILNPHEDESLTAHPSGLGRDERDLYHARGIGRRTNSESLDAFFLAFQEALPTLPMSRLPAVGVTYVHGQEIAPKLAYGKGEGDTTRLDPVDTIYRHLQRLSLQGVVGNKARESITVPVKRVAPKLWGDLVRLQVEVSDVRSEDPIHYFALHSERAPMMTAMKMPGIPNVRPTKPPRYAIPIAIFETDQLDPILAAVEKVESNLPVTLDLHPLGDVVLPLLKA